MEAQLLHAQTAMLPTGIHGSVTCLYVAQAGEDRYERGKELWDGGKRIGESILHTSA